MVLAMKKLHRLLAVLLALLMSAGTAGCAAREAASPVSLTVWHYYSGVQLQVFSDLVSAFNETVGAREGIFIEAYGKGSIDNLRNAVKDAAEHKIGAGVMPDIFSAYADYAFELYTGGHLVDLSAYLSEREQSEYIEAYLSEGNFSGKDSLYLFPIAKSTEVLWVNMTDFAPFAAACNVSEQDLSTWEGITATAKKYYRYTGALTDLPNGGKAFFGRDSMANYLLVGCAQLGAPLMQTENGSLSLTLDPGALRRLWDNYYVPYVSGHFASLGRFRSDDAKTGDIIAFVASSSGCSYFPNAITRADGSTYPITVKVLPLPNFADCAPYAVQQGAGMAVSKSDKRTEQAAVTFLKWLAEPAQNIRFSACTGYLPVQKAANNSDLLNTVAKEAALDLLPIVEDTLKVGMEMSGRYRFFTSAVSENSYACRSVVGSAMQAQADHDLAAITAQIDSGVDRQTALKPFLSDTHFEQWVSDFERALRKAATGA